MDNNILNNNPNLGSNSPKNSNFRQKFKQYFTQFKFQLSLIAFIILILTCYLSWKYSIISKKSSLIEPQKTTSEEEIFDINNEYQTLNEEETMEEYKLSDLSLEELKSGGLKLIHHILVRNQLQIENLARKVTNLKAELNNYRSQEKTIKIIFSYSDLRQKIFLGQNYNFELKNFDLLIVNDANLQPKGEMLKEVLKDFKSTSDLITDFKELIPAIIASKNTNPEASLFQKIRYNLLKLVIIRRINHPEIQDIDGILLRSEELIKKEAFAEALTLLASIPNSNYNILEQFLVNLNAANEVQKIDLEILAYLKTLSDSQQNGK
jgi:hypothetical protein